MAGAGDCASARCSLLLLLSFSATCSESHFIYSREHLWGKLCSKLNWFTFKKITLGVNKQIRVVCSLFFSEPEPRSIDAEVPWIWGRYASLLRFLPAMGFIWRHRWKKNDNSGREAFFFSACCRFTAQKLVAAPGQSAAAAEIWVQVFAEAWREKMISWFHCGPSNSPKIDVKETWYEYYNIKPVTWADTLQIYTL